MIRVLRMYTGINGLTLQESLSLIQPEMDEINEYMNWRIRWLKL